MNQAKYKNLIFDLDGVLVFTDEYHYFAWKAIADRLKIPFDKTVNNLLRGVSRMESLEIILRRSSMQFSRQDKLDLAEEKNAIYRKMLEDLTPASVDKETREVLTEFQEAGLGLAIGSSSKNAVYILEKTGLNDFFNVVSSGLNITNTKPHPEVFLYTAELLNAEPKDCLVIEDANAGIEAAVNGGFPCVGIGDAFNNPLATYRINSLKDLRHVVYQPITSLELIKTGQKDLS